MDSDSVIGSEDELLTVINRYFMQSENLSPDHEGREYEDDVAIYGKAVDHYDVIDVRQYSESDSSVQTNAYLRLKDEGADPPDDFAEILVHAVFHDHTTADYRFILFISGMEWKVACIDDASTFYLFGE